jgi:hypothetical protein
LEQLEDRLAPAILDLTTLNASGMINGAVFSQFTQQPAGSGTLNSFVKLSTSNTTEQGYNTDFRPVQFDEDNTPTFTHGLKLANIPTVIAPSGGVYYEFLLDINQSSSASLLSLDELRLYVTNPSTVHPNLLHNYNSTSHTLQDDAGTLYAPVYDLNPTTDTNYIKLDAKLSAANGGGDMIALIPAGLLGTDPNQYVYLYSELGVHFANNAGADEWAVANLPTGSISGSAFIDTNFNGVRDTGEPGQAGATVYLDANNNGILDPGEVSTVTSASDGSFSFSNLLPGTYHVREVVPAGYSQTAQINSDVNLTGGQNFAGVQFGNVRTGIVTLEGTTLVVTAQLGSQYTRTDGSTGFHGSDIVVSGTQSQFTVTVTDVAAGAGGADAVYPFNSRAFSPNITQVDLIGQAGDDSLDGRNFTGDLQSTSGGGRDAIFGSSTGSDTYNLTLHATGTDQISIVAPGTATNSLSFAGADQSVAFDLGQLNGTAQTVTASGDLVSYTGAITNYFTSNFNDTVKTPGANNQTFTGGSGNDTFIINPTSSSGSNDTFTINNSSFTGGTGNDTFTIGGGGGGTGNDTFTLSNSTFNIGSGNDTFTINGTSTGNDTFTINNSTFGGSGNDTFAINAGGGQNDTFTLSGNNFGSGSGNDTFTINENSASGSNDTFTINSSSFNTGTGNDTFTVNNGGTGNDTFTINNPGVFGSGQGNDTFTLNGSGTGNDTFTINGAVTFGSGQGNDTFALNGTGSGNDTFTIGGGVNLGGGTGNDTFTIGSNGTANDTFTIGGVTGGTGNDTFTVGSTGSGNDTFTMGTVSTGSGNDTFTMGSNGTGNDTFMMSSLSAGSGNDTFIFTQGGGANDTFTTTNGVTGTGNDTFVMSNSGASSGNDTFTMNSSITGSGNDTFTIQDTGTGASNDTFIMNGTITGGSGNDTFTINGGSGTGNDTFTINGSVNTGGSSGNDTFTIGASGTGNDTFTIGGGLTGGTGNDSFTIGSTGSGNDTFTIGTVMASGNQTFTVNGGVTVGNGNDTFTIGSAGGGNDTFTIGGVTAGAGNDTFLITGGGGGNDTFTIGSSYTLNSNGTVASISGGIVGSGNDTFTINDSGAASGSDTFTVNSNFTGGPGNNTFAIKNSNTGAGNDTFIMNGSISGGTGNGNDTFTIGPSGTGNGNDTFTINGSVNTGGSSGDDTFTMGASGSGNDTFTITGAVTSGSGNDAFTIGSTGSGNDTFTIGSINASGSSGNDTFTVGSSGTGNDTFTINGAATGGTGNDTFVFTSGGGGNDTFTVSGGVTASGSGNDTFVISGSGASTGNTTLAMNSNFTGGLGANQFFIQDTGTGGSNDTFTINSNFTGGSGNDTFIISNHGGGNDTFTINGGYVGSGNDTFTVNNNGDGNDTFTMSGGIRESGTGNDTFVVSNTGNGNDSFTLGNGFVGGSGQDIVTVNAVGNGNDSYAINGPVTLGNSNFSFFTISSDGSGSNNFSVTGPITAGNGDDFFDLGGTGTGTDNFTFAGPISFGTGTDSFQITGSGTGTENYNFQGGIRGNGYATYTINDPGSASGAESLTVSGNLGGGSGNNTFIITGGLQASGGTANFTLNGNLVGGAGYNAFSITNSGNPANSFVLNGGLVGGTNDVGDTFEFAGSYQNVSLTAGSGAGADTFMFAGAVRGNFSMSAPNQANRSDTLDFSTLSSGINLDISNTGAQQVANGLTIKLSDPNGITGVVGSAFGDTIQGNGRADLLRGSNILDPNYQASAPGPGANGKVQVVLLDFDTAYNQANGVYDFNSYYGQKGVTPLHVYTTPERNAIMAGLEADYAPYVQSGSIYFTMSQADAVAHAGGNTYITEYFDKTAIGGESGSVGAGTNVVAVGNSNDLDFRDVDMTGTGTIQLNGLLGEPLQPAATSQNWIYLSSKIAAHELGHLLGLHHADAFGAIGQGILPLPGGADYTPTYPGPHNAGETFNHVISSGDTIGFDSWNNIRGLFFGEREDVVLAYAFTAPSTPSDGTLLVAQHGSPTQANPQQLTLMPMTVPNTDLYGMNAGKTFEVQAVDVVGHIGIDSSTNKAEQDYYSFAGNAGDVMNINVMSAGITRYFSRGTSSYIDADAYLYQKNADGSLTLLGHNDDVFPNSAPGDASFVDFALPTTGTYVVKVTSFAFAPGQPHPDPNDPSLTPDERQNLVDAINGTDTGNYELFIYRFKAGVTTSGNDTFIPGSGTATIIGGSGTNPIVGPAAMNINATEFVASSVMPIASFSDSGNSVATTYSASIDWGDNSSPSAGTISVNGHTVTVLGGHTYNRQGTFTFTVTINQGPSTTVKLTSTATVLGRSILVLNPTASGALSMSGGASINVGGAVVVDSSSASAINLTGKGLVQASAIEAVGGIGKSSSTSFIPGVVQLSSPLPDPFAGLMGPSTIGMTNYGALSLGGSSSQTINPGIYTSIRVSNSAKLTMNPGIYIIEGGGFTVTSGGSVTGTGVMIYNAGSNYPNSGGTFGGISLNGSGSFSLSAPTNGPYAGIVIFQSRQNTLALSLGGGADGGLSGAIYAANALLSVSGGGQLQNALVVGTLSMNGTVALSQTATGSGATEAAVAGTLLAGNLNVYISDPGGYFTTDMLARVQDAITGIDTLLVPYNVTINEVSDPSQANVVLDNGTTSASGSAADGVLGSFVTTASGAEITILQGWNWYAGADPTLVGSGQYDFETTVTHELGHALGLGHSPNPGSPMYATLATATADRTLAQPDLDIPDPPSGAEPLRAAGFHEADASPVAMPGQNGERQAQPTQGDFTVGLVEEPDTNVVVTVPPSFGPITAVAGWTQVAFLYPKMEPFGVRPVSSIWLPPGDLRESVFESLGKKLQMGAANLQPQEGTVKMAPQAANGLGIEVVRVQASCEDQPSGHRAVQQDLETNEIRFVAEPANGFGTQVVRIQASLADQPSGRRAAQQDLETNEIRFVAKAGIDWFLVAGAATAMTLPSQALSCEDTERLLARRTRRKNGA